MTYLEPVTTPAITVETLRHAGVPAGAIDAPLGRLFVLLCQRYDLDPALKQLEVINTKNGPAVYITADGYRHIALASGLLDGITIPDTSQGEHGWRAWVQVWRQGCAHPFDGRAGCGFAEKKDDPEAQAITRATRRALRNAFDPIRVEAEYATLMRDSDVEDSDDVTAVAPSDVTAGAPPPAVTSSPPDPVASPAEASPPGPVVYPEVPSYDAARQKAARERFNTLGGNSRATFRRRHAITDMEAPWPEQALTELLGEA